MDISAVDMPIESSKMQANVLAQQNQATELRKVMTDETIETARAVEKMPSLSQTDTVGSQINTTA
ncbi:hypothetical protein [Thorsellia anophelis]|uniref:Motility protein n=1 Tax=Thorsellia anophelis DSM 18579 TaxID=1123402 RepID=A0A1I0C0H0_9GAMM|nr:hypothetical protein [Thorsellia anophelis]SET12859.1 hypothetical protein SAMN02583745_01442 [Thorsellia anophelis DSM 18579]